MAGSFKDALEVDVLKAITGQATTILTTTPLSNVYVALFTSAPTDSAAGTEVSGGSYARVQTASGVWGTPSAGSVTNSAGAITFPTATASWGTVVAFAICDASTAGNQLVWGDLTASKTIGSGDTASFATSQLTISLD